MKTGGDVISPTKLEKEQEVIEEGWQGDPEAQSQPPVNINNIGGDAGRDPNIREASEIKYEDTRSDNTGILGGVQ